MEFDQKYQVNHLMVAHLLTHIQTNEIAIPEIQRPFVWNSTKVRDLIDSLYQGFPVGYIVTWKNPDTKLKDGTTAKGKRILIDGQQRITALTAAVLGGTVKTKDYSDVNIRIAFNPFDRKFEVSNPAIQKNAAWIPDISPILTDKVNVFPFIKDYCGKNPSMDMERMFDIMSGLKDLTKKEIGVIELAGELDIDAVTEIFIRINSQGVPLSQADFVMSKIAADEHFGGNMLRKCIDHFSHLAVKPEFYGKLKENDCDFVESEYFHSIAWLRHEIDDTYDPSYVDILRVAFLYKFARGSMGDLVSLLSGRNFETREFEYEIQENTYKQLIAGVKDFINEYNFKKFVMIVRSAGFCHSKLIRSQNAMNFAYALFLKLREQKYAAEKIDTYVRKWLVLSFLTGRYSSSPESQFDYDIRQVENRDFEDFLSDVESAQLSDAFWNAEIVQRLETSLSSNPIFNVFIASQCMKGKRGFLSSHITVKDMIEERGDVHHIFPRQYLIDKGFTRTQYNQVANYVYVQTEINIKIGKKAPNEYFAYIVNQQCAGGATKYGGITEKNQLLQNMADNCIPVGLEEMDANNYDDFLKARRQLMAEAIKEYYDSL